jgi:hypothetical protein
MLQSDAAQNWRFVDMIAMARIAIGTRIGLANDGEIAADMSENSHSLPRNQS